MIEYLENIRGVVTTVADGMAVTFSHLVRKPYTVQYPDRIPQPVQETLPSRYRGILDVEMAICTGCLACERACPIECIVIKIARDKETKTTLISRFDIDIAKCMYCGLCTEPCPTGAIQHTSEFEGASESIEQLVRRFVSEPVSAYKPQKAGESDARIALLLEKGKRYLDEFAKPARPTAVSRESKG